MSDPAPPFSALRAVEAASRHRSYTWAAKELNVTHSAVSQSIKRLETELGATLFERKGGGMEPSDAALRLAKTYAEAAGALDRVLKDISASTILSELTIAMPPDFGRLWFSAKLARLHEAMPDISVQARIGDAGDQRREDIVIGFGAVEAQRSAESITELRLIPVCSPAFAATRDLRKPEDLSGLPLMAAAGSRWDLWASHFGLTRPQGWRAHSFDDPGMSLDAAAQGGGVLLSHLFAAEPYLESGRLVALPLDAPSGRHLHVRGVSGGKADLIQRFDMWLRVEVSRTLAMHAARLKSAERQTPSA